MDVRKTGSEEINCPELLTGCFFVMTVNVWVPHRVTG